MISISDKEYQKILNIIYDANLAENIGDFTKIVIPQVSQLFNSKCITFQILELLQKDVKVMESKSYKVYSSKLVEDSYFPTLYKDSYYQHSPLLKSALNSRRNVYKIGNDITLPAWEQSKMYNYFILPQNLYWEILLAMRGKNNLHIVTLWREKKEHDFSDLELLKANILVPHLVQTINKNRIISAIKYGASVDKNVKQSEEGLLLLDFKLKPFYFNSKAADICAKIDNVWINSKEDINVPKTILENCANILRIYKITGEPSLFPRIQFLRSTRDKSFGIEYSMAWKTDQTGSLSPYFVICLNEQNTPDRPTEPDLTKREAEILSHLLNGLSYDEIARRLFISNLTVHTHIRNIYRKLGTHNKFDLIKISNSSYPPK